MDSATIAVPSSSANCGVGYDIHSVGLKNPYLRATGTRTNGGIEIECRSAHQPPAGRELGYAGRLALVRFFRNFGIKEGIHLLYEDGEGGYPVGGGGRSGAEIVGAFLAAAVVYGKKIIRNKFIARCHEVEGHPDNVAASTNGRFNIIALSPHDSRMIVDCYDTPENLGLAIGFSSHQKTGGTEAGRKVLRDPVSVGDFVAQTGSVSMLTAALVSGNTDRFIEFVGGDRFHEPRRANVGFYGNFNAPWLNELKRELYREFHVGWSVSGAGPGMQAWYSKTEHPSGIVPVISEAVERRFAERGISMRLQEMRIAKEGAYDYAQRNYGF